MFKLLLKCTVCPQKQGGNISPPALDVCLAALLLLSGAPGSCVVVASACYDVQCTRFRLCLSPSHFQAHLISRLLPFPSELKWPFFPLSLLYPKENKSFETKRAAEQALDGVSLGRGTEGSTHTIASIKTRWKKSFCQHLFFSF